MTKPDTTLYRIGTDAHADFRLDHETVAPLHAELVRVQSGGWYLTCCFSAGGCRVWRGDAGWVPLRQAFIAPNDRLCFGEVEIPFATIIAQLGAASSESRPVRSSAPGGPLERDPATGSWFAGTGNNVGDPCARGVILAVGVRLAVSGLACFPCGDPAC